MPRCLVNLQWRSMPGGKIMGILTRRKFEIKLPAVEKCFVDLSAEELKFYEDKTKVEEISNKGGTTIEISIPKEIENLEIRKSGFPPIVALGTNRQIWPKEGAVSIRLIMDNRDINMLDEDGNFRRKKYIELYQCTAWKRWALLIYTYEDGSLRSILWWKK